MPSPWLWGHTLGEEQRRPPAPPHRTSGQTRTLQLPFPSPLWFQIPGVHVKARALLLSQLLLHRRGRGPGGPWSWDDSALFSAVPMGPLGKGPPSAISRVELVGVCSGCQDLSLVASATTSLGYLVRRGCDQHTERGHLEAMWPDFKPTEEPRSTLLCSVLKNGRVAARDGAWGTQSA